MWITFHVCRSVLLKIHLFRKIHKAYRYSFIKIIEKKGSQLISVLNPSINDYIEGRLKENVILSVFCSFLSYSSFHSCLGLLSCEMMYLK